jgi:15-cis-phytoene synthase
MTPTASPTASPPDSERAYRYCESLTRTAAANFYYGIRLLPAPKRRAMCAVYALARRIDDIGDGSLPPSEKLAQLDAVQAQLASIDRPSDDPVMVALADAEAIFLLPLNAFDDLIAGVRMDVQEHRYASFEELELYCRRVAGSIGRLCVAIFGSPEPAATALADDLGVAMQLTNILRDVREDAGRGRVYLPAEDLDRFGVDDVRKGSPDAMAALIGFEAARAREWFARGLKLLELLDGRSAACVIAMTGIYRRLLDRIEADPQASLQRRLSLPVWEKAWVAARSLTTAGVRSLTNGRDATRAST